MAHYAFLDKNNIVTQVIVGRDETDLPEGVTSWEEYYGQQFGQVCKQTSYNTFGGIHRTGGVPFRKNYAGIGFTYDEDRDAFIPPQPYSSWSLDEESCLWQSPVPYPLDGQFYEWDESILNWSLVTNGEGK